MQSVVHADCYLGDSLWLASRMARRRDATSVKEGRLSGSVDQHCSISFLHSGLHEFGTGGRSVLLKIPPAYHTSAVAVTGADKRYGV